MTLQTFTHQGLIFPVRDEGPGEGEVVVLLHGFPQLPVSYDAVVPRLHEAGYRTLIPTGRGYAPSCRPHRRREYAGTQLAGDVVALLDAAGVAEAHLVGHDWGGGQAWTTAALHPGRVRSLTVLSTPHPAAMVRTLFTGDQWRRSWYMALFQLPWLPERFARRMIVTLDRAGLPAEHTAAYREAFPTPDSLTGPINWYRGIAFSRPLGPVGVPTTYVWGRRDPFLGPDAAHATEAYVRAPYRFVELDAGHWLPEKAAAEVTDAVLQRVRG